MLLQIVGTFVYIYIHVYIYTNDKRRVRFFFFLFRAFRFVYFFHLIFHYLYFKLPYTKTDACVAWSRALPRGRGKYVYTWCRIVITKYIITSSSSSSSCASYPCVRYYNIRTRTNKKKPDGDNLRRWITDARHVRCSSLLLQRLCVNNAKLDLLRTPLI